jgi:hypothetical protein
MARSIADAHRPLRFARVLIRDAPYDAPPFPNAPPSTPPSPGRQIEPPRPTSP